VGPVAAPPVPSLFVEHDEDLADDDAVEVDTFDDSPDDAVAMGDVDFETDDFDIDIDALAPTGVDRAPGDHVATVTDEGAEVTAASVDIDVAVLDGIEQELADVEVALRRLGDGTYGTCENCGQVVTDAELEEAPAGRYCRAHLPLTLP
jgi:DnaK suppressor protein